MCTIRRKPAAIFVSSCCLHHQQHPITDADRRLLTAASVEGAEFHAAVVAEAMGSDEDEIEESLERLDRVHALVCKVGEEEMPDGSLTLRYGFVHSLYQNALYETLQQ